MHKDELDMMAKEVYAPSNAINPNYYKDGDVECIDAIKSALGDKFSGFLAGNVIKYVWRYRGKNGVIDLEKAKWYLETLIYTERLQRRNKNETQTTNNKITEEYDVSRKQASCKNRKGTKKPFV